MLPAGQQTSSEEQPNPVNGSHQKTFPEEVKQSRNGAPNAPTRPEPLPTGQQISLTGEQSGKPVARRSPKLKSGQNVEAPRDASNEDDLFENLPLSAVATVEWITEQGIITHLLFQNQNFEVLDVRADGNCFYSMISVGLAFHNIFLSMKNVKRNIFTHMHDLWEI